MRFCRAEGDTCNNFAAREKECSRAMIAKAFKFLEYRCERMQDLLKHRLIRAFLFKYKIFNINLVRKRLRVNLF